MRSKKPAASPNPGNPQTPETPSGQAATIAALSTPTEEKHLVDVEEAAPVTASRGVMSAQHHRFCQEYLVDLNGTKAYQRVYVHAAYETARTRSQELLQNPPIRSEIQRLLDERAALTGVTADRVLLRLWNMATADPRELVEVRVGSCRHCWGLYNQYQYTDREWEKALSEHVHREAKRRKAEGDDFVPAHCPEKGGTGYTPNRPPSPECPECHGDGEPRSIIKDQKNLSPGALALFGGVKYDKNGNMSVLVREQLPALKLVAEHLGLFSDKLAGPQTVDPLSALLEALRGPSGTGAALPVVSRDPEQRPDVEDVEEKPAKAATVAASGPRKWGAVK